MTWQVQNLHEFSQTTQGGMSVEDLFKTLPERQANLEKYVKNAIVEAKLAVAPQIIISGQKTVERAKEKTDVLLDGNPAQLHDLSRIKLYIDKPTDSDAILACLQKKGFDACLPDWHFTNRGHVRRKVFVAVPDNQGRHFVSEILFEMIMKLPHEVKEEHIRKAYADIYKTMRKMDIKGYPADKTKHVLISATDPPYAQQIWPEFLALARSIRETLPANYVTEDIMNPPIVPVVPEVLGQLLVEQSRRIVDHVMQHQDQAWRDLKIRLEATQNEINSPVILRR